ncbi:MAG: TetR/AcrR family transcriptional regulator [Actinobacteria bacterium]|nr:TetR/AcrR family transcriptional regulator [Actinomycetota bacterium]
MVKTLRQTAEQRREAVLEAARIEFARHGLHGASTDAIARRAGISQPYLFRLFGTKKELFLALNDAWLAETLEVFREAASGKSGKDALSAIGDAYRGLIDSDRTMLQGQLQSYAASVEDDDVRESTARGYGRLVDYVETVSGADRPTISAFFATGMLLNVLAAMQYSIGDDPRDSWVARLADGCKGAE